MRELKFRVWNKIMRHYRHFVLQKGVSVSIGADLEIEQCTGLKDKNGKEIYEGDILHSKVGTDYVVSYSVDKGRYEMWSKDGCGGGIADVQYIKEFNIEVIGNIHENPELLG